MSRILVREFDPIKHVYARKAFTANGHKITPNTELEWRKLAINQRRVKQLYDAGYLKHGDEMPRRELVRERKMAEAVPIEELIDFEDKAEPETPQYPIHVGGPWYELSNGEKVMGKNAAENAEAEL